MYFTTQSVDHIFIVMEYVPVGRVNIINVGLCSLSMVSGGGLFEDA
jgi:hypothetical protein